MDIIGLTNDRGGCAFYRLILPMYELSRHGMTVNIQNQLTTQDKADIVVGQRVFTHSAWKQARDFGFKMVFEIDDDLWNVHKTNPNSNSKLERTGMIECIKNSDAVTVSTDALADIVRQWNPNVHVLPNCIPGALTEFERPRSSDITIGWSGGDSHMNDFIGRPSTAAVSEIATRYDCRLHMIGFDMQHAFQCSKKSYTPWQPEVTDFYKKIDFDIGIAPLADNTFNRSKSHIRALEYSALGIPVIASDVEPYAKFIVHGETGFLAKNYKDWHKYLKLLVTNDDLRERMGNAARERSKEYIIEHRWSEWSEVYSGLMG